MRGRFRFRFHLIVYLGCCGVFSTALLPMLCLAGLIEHPCHCPAVEERQAHHPHCERSRHAEASEGLAGSCSHDSCDEDPCQEWQLQLPASSREFDDPMPLEVTHHAGIFSASDTALHASPDRRLNRDDGGRRNRRKLPFPPPDLPLRL